MISPLGVGPHCRLSINHVSAVGKHRHAREWEAVVVPGDSRETCLGHKIHSLFHARILIADGNVDVGDHEVDRRNEVDSCHF